MEKFQYIKWMLRSYKKKLKEDYWGTGKKFILPNDIFDCDPNYWGGKLLIIKGEIIVPKAKQTIIEYEV